MSSLAPMIVAAIIILAVFFCRNRGIIGSTLLALIYRLDSWTMELAEDVRRPVRQRGDGTWEVLTMRSRIYLTGIGAWFVVTTAVGLLGAAIFGLFGGIVFAFFPGSLIGALVYQRMIR